MEILSGIDSVYENYYIRFALLIIICLLYTSLEEERDHSYVSGLLDDFTVHVQRPAPHLITCLLYTSKSKYPVPDDRGYNVF